MTQDPFSSQAADSFLTGGGVTAKFPRVGHTYSGTVLSFEMVQQRDYDTNEPLTWDDGKPRMQMAMELQCEPTGQTWEGLERTPKAVPNDDGCRTLYIKGSLQKAFKKALKEAGGVRPEVGAHVTVERIKDLPKTDPKKAAPHDFKVTWTPAAKNAQAASDFLNSADAGDDESPF